jgi:hypothetical protein
MAPVIGLTKMATPSTNPEKEKAHTITITPEIVEYLRESLRLLPKKSPQREAIDAAMYAGAAV